MRCVALKLSFDGTQQKWKNNNKQRLRSIAVYGSGWGASISVVAECVVSINGGSQLEELVRCKQIDNCADVFTVFFYQRRVQYNTHCVGGLTRGRARGVKSFQTFSTECGVFWWMFTTNLTNSKLCWIAVE